MKNLITKLEKRYFPKSFYAKKVYRGLHFKNEELIGMFFGVEFINCKFSGCTFYGIEFGGVKFTGCNFIGSKFTKCVLSDTHFKVCKFTDTDFEGCEHTDGVIMDCEVDGGTFLLNNFREFRFLNTVVSDVKFKNTFFTDCYMRDFDLVEDVVMLRCVFIDSYFVFSWMDGGIFSDCNGIFESDRMYSTGRPVYAFKVDGKIRVKDGDFYGTLEQLRERTSDCIFHVELCDNIIPKYFKLK